MSNRKRIRTKTWFVNWFKYFQAYLEMARIGLLQLDQQKYPPENVFKKDALYGDQILLIPIIWSLKHSIELLFKALHVRISQEFSLVHDNTQLYHETRRSLSGLGITDDQFVEKLINLSDKYFKLKFWNSFLLSSSDIYDDVNDIFRYPESRVNFSLGIEELYKVTEEDKLELKNDIKELTRLSVKLHRQITSAKIRRGSQ